MTTYEHRKYLDEDAKPQNTPYRTEVESKHDNVLDLYVPTYDLDLVVPGPDTEDMN